MHKMIGRIAGGTAALLTGMLLAAAPTAPAHADQVSERCNGTAVKRCVQVRNPARGEFRAWAKVSDANGDNANYFVWIRHLELQICENGPASCRSIARTSDLDGRHPDTDLAATRLASLPCDVPVRAKASVRWVRNRTSDVRSDTVVTAIQRTCS